jgi:glutaredoxin
MSLLRPSIPLLFAAAMALCIAGAAGAQQLYRWVDEHGHVTYSDRPPPPEAVEVEERATSAGGSGQEAPVAATLPMEDAVARAPVTLFAVDDCDACDLVRMYLRNRGVPFTDLDVGDDQGAQIRLQALVGRLEVPTVSIGGQVLAGYNRSALDIAMGNAGYPEAGAIDPSAAAPIPATEGDNGAEPVIPEDLLDDLPGS